MNRPIISRPGRDDNYYIYIQIQYSVSDSLPVVKSFELLSDTKRPNGPSLCFRLRAFTEGYGDSNKETGRFVVLFDRALAGDLVVPISIDLAF